MRARRRGARPRDGTCARASASRCATALMRMLRRKPPVRWISLARCGAGWSVVVGTDARCALCVARDLCSARLLSFTVVVDAGARPRRQQHDLQPDGRAGPAARIASPASIALVVADHGARDADFFDRINVTAADFREWREQSTHASSTGRCTSGGTPTCPASTFPSRCRRSLCRRDSSSCWAPRRSWAASLRERGAAGPASSRRARARAVGAAIRIRSEHRRQERAAGRRAVRSRRRCADRASPRPMAPSCGRRLR